MTERLEKRSKITLSRALSAILLVFALVFAGYILWREGSKIPWQEMHFNLWLLMASLVITTIGYIPILLGWRMILRLYHVQSIWQDDVRNYIYSMLGTMLPGGIWMLVGRSVLYKKQAVSGVRVTSASVLETILIGLAGWVVYWIGLMIRPDLGFVKWNGFQYVILIPVLVLLEPHILSRITSWVLRKSQPNTPVPPIHFALSDIFVLIGFETLVVIFGGVGVFTLIRSVFEIDLSLLVNIIAAYGFSIAFSNLFFWLPGQMVIKDSSLAVALAQSTPASMAVIFVILIRLWTIFTVLLPAALTWLLLDFLVRKPKQIGF